MGTCNVTCVSDWVRWLLRTGVAALGGTGLFGRHAQRAHVGGDFPVWLSLLFLLLIRHGRMYGDFPYLSSLKIEFISR